MRISDVMHREPSVCRPETTLAEAGRVMASIDCGILPVVDETESVLGVLTDRDICLALTERNARPSTIFVRDVMSRDVATCRAHHDLSEALGKMRSRRVRRLPVVSDDGLIEGILSLDDVVLLARGSDTPGLGGPLYDELGRTMRAICEHPLPARIGQAHAND